MKKIGLLIALLLVVGAIPAWAVNCPVDNWIHDKAASNNYGVRAGGVFLQGINLIVKSPYELFYHIYDETKKDHALGLFRGIGVGVGQAAGNVGVGVIDILGSPVPGFHGVAWGEQEEKSA